MKKSVLICLVLVLVSLLGVFAVAETVNTTTVTDTSVVETVTNTNVTGTTGSMFNSGTGTTEELTGFARFLKIAKEVNPMLLQGLWVTIWVSVLAIIIGLFVGLLTCFMGRSNNIILKSIAAVYVWCIRGTPLMVQAFVVYYGIPVVVQIWQPDFVIPALNAGLITLSLNAGAYMSEIFRGGIAAVNKGQVEAARSLGLNKTRTMVKIVLPQAFKLVIPSLVNQFIITIKDSSILSVISMQEIMKEADIYVGRTYNYFEPYAIVAVYYLALLSVLMVASKFIEKKLNYDKKS